LGPVALRLLPVVFPLGFMLTGQGNAICRMVWAYAKAVAFGLSLYWLPQRLRLEVTSCKCQAHNSYSTKNNENDVLHGVISFLKK
jgi:hypothetical protein